MVVVEEQLCFPVGFLSRVKRMLVVVLSAVASEAAQGCGYSEGPVSSDRRVPVGGERGLSVFQGRLVFVLFSVVPG